jgi:GTP-binding protein
MSKPLQMEFVLSAPDVDTLPPTRRELAFLGRSNVGKSSLLNALAGEKLAYVSNTPGRTQMLVCFQLHEPRATVIDCPGYGFAKAPKALREGWQAMVEHYLVERENLTRALLLVDGEVGPTEKDKVMLAWLRDRNVPHTVVATKQDQVKPSQLARREREVAAGCRLPASAVHWVSSLEGTGIARLREMVRLWLG